MNVSSILSGLERAYSHGDGLTVNKLLDNAKSSREAIQAALCALEGEGLVTSERIVGRGEVYRLRVFANLEELCEKMPRSPGQSVILP